MASMIGVVTADNVILLYISWELTSISSYLLIGYKHQHEKSRKAALQALLVTGAGGLALLPGLIMLATVGVVRTS
jgi:multicomponent Na+:H+ antiporter subunit A